MSRWMLITLAVIVAAVLVYFFTSSGTSRRD